MKQKMEELKKELSISTAYINNDEVKSILTFCEKIDVLNICEFEDKLFSEITTLAKSMKIGVCEKLEISDSELKAVYLSSNDVYTLTIHKTLNGVSYVIKNQSKTTLLQGSYYLVNKNDIVVEYDTQTHEQLPNESMLDTHTQHYETVNESGQQLMVNDYTKYDNYYLEQDDKIYTAEIIESKKNNSKNILTYLAEDDYILQRKTVNYTNEDRRYKTISEYFIGKQEDENILLTKCENFKEISENLYNGYANHMYGIDFIVEEVEGPKKERIRK